MNLQAYDIYIIYHLCLRHTPVYDSAASAFEVQNPKSNFVSRIYDPRNTAS